MATVVLDRITRRFGDVLAVDDVSLAVAEGELLVLLGPSGCGKTTTLRMIAGFIETDGGTVRIGERDVTPDSARTGATSAWCSRTTRCSRI